VIDKIYDEAESTNRNSNQEVNGGDGYDDEDEEEEVGERKGSIFYKI
jgi:hypothetical protein